MADINISRYFSQWDGDNGGAKGACGETCLKMIDHYLTGREIAISEIIKHGDRDPSITSLAGMQVAADWLGFGLDIKRNVTEAQIKQWLSEGKLVIGIIKYSLWPNKYKQDEKYPDGHFILITGIASDNSIRFADPNFWGARREEGWMNNGKWASYGDFYKAAYHNASFVQNGTVLVSRKAKPKPPAPTPPPTDPCADVKKQLTTVTAERDSLKKTVTSLETQVKNLNADISKLKSDHQNTVTKMTAEHNLKISEMKGNHDKKYNALEESKREMEDQHKVIVDELVLEKGRLEEELAKVPQQLADKDVVIEAQRQRIEQLLIQNTEEISNYDLVRIIIKRLFRK